MQRQNPIITRPFGVVLASGLVLMVAVVWAHAASTKPEGASETAPAPGKKSGNGKAVELEAKPVTNTPPITVAFPKAVFSVALDGGKDPFFPASKRRLPKPPPVVVPIVKPPPPVKVVAPPVPTPPVTPSPLPISPAPSPAPAVPKPPAPVPVVVVKPDLLGAANLSLRGISGVASRRVAVIHTGAKSYDFLKGELMLLRLPNDQQLKVRCVEIRGRSAVFQVEGETETKELFLREGL